MNFPNTVSGINDVNAFVPKDSCSSSLPIFGPSERTNNKHVSCVCKDKFLSIKKSRLAKSIGDYSDSDEDKVTIVTARHAVKLINNYNNISLFF
jgi:hypothetical protein